MHRPLNWIQWLTLALVPVLAALVVIVILQIQRVQHHQNDALHSIICFVSAAEQRSKTLTVTQKRQAIRFWVAALHDAHLGACP